MGNWIDGFSGSQTIPKHALKVYIPLLKLLTILCDNNYFNHISPNGLSCSNTMVDKQHQSKVHKEAESKFSSQLLQVQMISDKVSVVAS
jgi:hypothetical protein